MISGSTLMSSSPRSGSLNFQQPAEKNGTYVGVSGDFVGYKKSRLGLNVETAWRYRQADYPFNGETYRPIFTDVNALFQPRLGKVRGKEIDLDLMGGIGVVTTRFNVPPASSCALPAGGCVNYTSSNHFAEHLGIGLRYRFWRRLFIRPEVHYYHIENNVEFNSGNVFRLGASLGYTFGKNN